MSPRDSRGRFTSGNLGDAVVSIEGDLDPLGRALNDAEAATRRSAQIMADEFDKLGRSLSLAVTLPLSIAGGAVLKFGSDFEKAMTQSTAIMTGLSSEMAGAMERAALDIGRTSSFGASEAAEAYFFLASAGLDAAQSISALPQVVAFATAGQFDLARATDLATDAQSALGLTSKDAAQNLENLTRVTDVFIAANTLANATAEQFSEAITSKGGAALRSFGKDIEEGVAVLAAFADQGSKGALAGERLNQIISQLPKLANQNAEEFEALGIAVFDSEGNFRNLADIIQDFEEGLAGATDQQRAAAFAALGFGEEVAAALNQLIGSSAKIKEYEDALRAAGGTTQEIAEKQTQNFQDALGRLVGRIETAAISLYGELAPALNDIVIPALSSAVSIVEMAVEAFAALSPEVQGLIVGMVALAAALGPLAVGIAAVQKAFIVMTAAAAIPAIATFGTVAAAVAAVIGVTAAFVAAWQNFGPEIQAVLDTISRDFWATVDNMKESLEDAGDAFRELWVYIQEGFSTIRDWLPTWAQSFLDVIVAMLNEAQGAFGTWFGNLASAFGGMFSGDSALARGFNNWTREMGEGWEILMEAIRGDVAFLNEDLGDPDPTLFEKIQAALGEVGDALEKATFDALEFGKGGSAAAKQVAREIEAAKRQLEAFQREAETIRLRLFPEEQIAADLQQLQRFIDAFPEIADQDFAGRFVRDIADSFQEADFAAFDLIRENIEGVDQALLDAFDEARVEAMADAILDFVAATDAAKNKTKEARDEFTFEDQLSTTAGFINDIAGDLANVGRAIGGTFGKVSQVIQVVAQGIGGVIAAYLAMSQAATAAAGTASAAWIAILGPIGLVTAAISAAASLFGLFGDEAEEELTGIDKLFEELEQSIEEWGERLTDVIVDFVTTGEASFRDFVNSVLEDMLRLTTQTLLVDPLVGALQGAFAKGAAFEGGNVIPFAKGGVISSPALVPLRGGKGLMGEAGPEAIMPLKRGADGALGVAASGGGGGVTVNIINNAPVQIRQEERTINGLEVIDVIIEQAVAKQLAEGAHDAILERFGAKRRGF